VIAWRHYQRVHGRVGIQPGSLNYQRDRGPCAVRPISPAALHRSLDGTKVTMYAQWRTVEDYQRMRGRSDTSPFLAEAVTIATFDPGLYEVVEIFLPEEAKAKR
jgi:hypothetical protein